MRHTFHCHLRKSLNWYHDWHNHPKHSHAHWAGFLIFTTLLLSYLTGQIEDLEKDLQLNTANAQGSTTLTISGNRFLLNGQAKFLILATYFDGIDSPNPAGDLDYLKSKGFDGIRIMPNWWDFPVLNPLFNVDGSINQTRLNKLRQILDAANARGMVVDITFTIENVPGQCIRTTNNPVSKWDSMCVPLFKQAVVSVVQSLSNYQNIIYDLQNESDGPNKITKFCDYIIDPPNWTCTDGGVIANLSDLANRIRSQTSNQSPLSTSYGGNVSEANSLASVAGLDIANWHIPNGQDPSGYAYGIGGVSTSSRPTYVGEPWHTNWNDGVQVNPATTQDFIDRAVAAKQAGLSAWTFHIRGSWDLNSRTFQQSLYQSEIGFVDSFKSILDGTTWGGGGVGGPPPPPGGPPPPQGPPPRNIYFIHVDKAPVGTTVTITGDNLGTAVSFISFSGTVTTATGNLNPPYKTELRVIVPLSLVVGTYKVRVGSNPDSNEIEFEVLDGVFQPGPTSDDIPVIISINPVIVSQGGTLEIFGESLSPQVRLTSIDGAPTDLNGWVSTDFKTTTVNIPETIVPGIYTVSVTNKNGTTSSPDALTVIAGESSIPPVDTPPFTPTATGFQNLISSAFNYSIIIVGIAVFIMIMWGGFLWLTSAANPGNISRAKGIISNAIIGAVLLVSAYVILYTINPELVGGTFTLPGIPAAAPPQP